MCFNKWREANSARVAYGEIFVKEYEGLTDEETVTAITENPYIYFFLGLKEFADEPLFDSSIMVHFRKRVSAEDFCRINEMMCTGKDQKETKNEEDNNQDDDRKSPPSSQAG